MLAGFAMLLRVQIKSVGICMLEVKSCYEFIGPIFEHSSKSGPYHQDFNLRLNVQSAKFVEAIITDSWSGGFKNYDNLKPGHRNIYVNGGENHPYCEPLGWIDESKCRHQIPRALLIYLNNNHQCPK